MNTDPISDMLTRVRNAQAVNKKEVLVPYSDFKYNVIKCIEKEGFVESVIKRKVEREKYINITLKYENNKPTISEIKRVSSPGQRIYSKKKDLRGVKGGRGIFVLSTPKGVMTNKEARSKEVGGEIICEVW